MYFTGGGYKIFNSKWLDKHYSPRPAAAGKP